jgi:hypothetical protein
MTPAAFFAEFEPKATQLPTLLFGRTISMITITSVPNPVI